MCGANTFRQQVVALLRPRDVRTIVQMLRQDVRQCLRHATCSSVTRPHHTQDRWRAEELGLEGPIVIGPQALRFMYPTLQMARKLSKADVFGPPVGLEIEGVLF